MPFKSSINPVKQFAILKHLKLNSHFSAQEVFLGSTTQVPKIQILDLVLRNNKLWSY